MEERELDFSDILSAIRKWFLLILLFIILNHNSKIKIILFIIKSNKYISTF